MIALYWELARQFHSSQELIERLRDSTLLLIPALAGK